MASSYSWEPDSAWKGLLIQLRGWFYTVNSPLFSFCCLGVSHWDVPWKSGRAVSAAGPKGLGHLLYIKHIFWVYNGNKSAPFLPKLGTDVSEELWRTVFGKFWRKYVQTPCVLGPEASAGFPQWLQNAMNDLQLHTSSKGTFSSWPPIRKQYKINLIARPWTSCCEFSYTCLLFGVLYWKSYRHTRKLSCTSANLHTVRTMPRQFWMCTQSHWFRTSRFYPVWPYRVSVRHNQTSNGKQERKHSSIWVHLFSRRRAARKQFSLPRRVFEIPHTEPNVFTLKNL